MATTNDLLSFVRSQLSQQSKAQREEMISSLDLSIHTVQKIAKGEIKDPSCTKIEKLAKHFGAEILLPKPKPSLDV